MSTNSACLQILSSFVGRRCIDIPDGRPICAYRGTAEEFRSIGEAVRSRCTGATRATRLPIGASALFCLYAAEWWRRNHEGGPWRWEEILTSSGLDHLPLLELYEVVQHGLKYWKRPLLNRSKCPAAPLIGPTPCASSASRARARAWPDMPRRTSADRRLGGSSARRSA